MRPFKITDQKILDEQQQLVDRYMKEAPEDASLHDFIFTNCSEYMTEFYEKRRKELEAEGDIC